MIPKTIHWIWFSDKDKIPDQFQPNFDSWKRFFPDHEIKMHDESNYDVNKHPFTKEQYGKGNYAFVADFARLDIIYQEGGIYFDTDVEILRPFDDLPEQFFGFEACFYGVNSGSGFRCKAGHPLFKKLLNAFSTRNVIQEYFDTGVLDMEEPTITLKLEGLICDNSYQIVHGIHFLPNDFLCPIFYNEKLYITNNTKSIHKYAMSWLDEEEQFKIINIRNTISSSLISGNEPKVIIAKSFSYEEAPSERGSNNNKISES